MLINSLLIGKFCNKLFTGELSKRPFVSPVIFTGDTIYIFAEFLIVLFIRENTVLDTQNSRIYFPIKLKSRKPQMTITNRTSRFCVCLWYYIFLCC